MVKLSVTPSPLPSEGIMFVDHQSKGRSGHLSHALCEYKPGCIMAFYSNCSGKRNKWAPGHNGFGWIEWKKSFDYGKTWTKQGVLPYSLESFLNEPFTVSCEKAVSPAENVVVAFCIRNENPNGWEPYLEPVVLRSEDGGESWEEPFELSDKCGRIYDAFVHEGAIYVMELAFNDFMIEKPDQRYLIYRSTDLGKSFEQISELPGDYIHHAYGNMVVRPDGAFIAYAYCQDDEFNMKYWISYDNGLTWPETGKSYCAKRIRNPQAACVNGGYILHGRSGCMGKELPMDFVLYTSEDGIKWDEGVFLCSKSCGTAYYSNNLVINENGKQRVLIQSSVPYDRGRVNIAHWWLDIE